MRKNINTSKWEESALKDETKLVVKFNLVIETAHMV